MRAGLFMVTALLWGWPAPALACSCVQWSVPEAEQAASAVFRGAIVAVSPEETAVMFTVRRLWCAGRRVVGAEALPECYEAKDGFVATFLVSAVWKGEVGSTVRVKSDRPGGGSCGLHWEVGADWLIYAHGSGRLSTSFCSRSVRGSDAAVEAGVLGPPRTVIE
jgi:hypothetical protein